MTQRTKKLFCTWFGFLLFLCLPALAFAQATLATDKADYAPGEIVTITGTGWQPGETVSLLLQESPKTHDDRTLTAVADSSGRILNNQFAPEAHDLGVTFYLTATGLSSGLTAQTTFTDAPSQAFITVTATPTGAIGGTFQITRVLPNGTTQPNGGTTSQTFAVQPNSSFSITTVQSPVNGLTYVGSATVTGTAGAANTTTTVTLQYQAPCPSGLAISGSVANFCQGAASGSVTLSATGSNLTGATITWKLDATTLGTGTSITVTAATLNALLAGSHTITATATKTGCSDASASTGFTVNGLPSVSITGPTEACQSTSVTFTAVPSGGSGSGYTFLWNTGATTAGISPSTAAAGTSGFSVTVTDSNTCTSPAASQNLTVHPKPVVNISGAPVGAILSGTSVSLTADVSDGTAPFTYAWTKNGSSLATTASVTDTPSLGSTDYEVTVTDVHGCVSNKAKVTVSVYDFTLSLSPDQTVLRGLATGNYTVSATLATGSAGAPASVSLALSGLPLDATGSGFPASLALSTFGASANFTVQTAATTPVGEFILTATPTPGGASKAATVKLRIFDFSLSLSPDQSVLRGLATGNYTVSATLTTGSAGAPASLSLALSGLPLDATAAAFPASVALPGSATFTVQTAATTPLGESTLTATPTPGGVSKAATAKLRIFDFSLALSPDQTVLRGLATGNYTVSATLTTGSAGAPASLSLALSGLPLDAAAGSFPASVALPGSANFTVQTAATTPLGEFTLAATPTPGGASKAATAKLRIFDYAVSVSPTDHTVRRGCSTSYTVNVTLLLGSTTIGLPSVSLGVSGAPSDATTTLAGSVALPTSSGSSTATTLDVATGATSLGDSTLTVTGTVGSATRSSSAFFLHIYDYSLSVTPSPLAVAQNQQGAYTVAVTLAAGSATPPALTLSISGLPGGVTGTFNSTTLTPTNSTLLTISPTSPATMLPVGTFSLTVSATDGSCPRQSIVQLNVINAMIGALMRDTDCNAIPNGADVVFTPPNAASMKLSATNPGGYMYNTSIKNTGGASTVGLVLNLPPNDPQDVALLPAGSSAFAAWGSRPVHVFTSDPCAPGATDITPAGIVLNTAAGPLGQPLSTNSTLTTGSIVVPAITIPAGGTIWVQVHVRYGLIGSTGWPSNSQTTFVRGYQSRASFTGGLALTNPVVTSFTETGKRVTAIGGTAVDMNGVTKGGLGVSVDGTVVGGNPATCSNPNVLAANMIGFYFIPVPASTGTVVRLCNSLGTQIAQQSFSAVAQDEFRQIDFLNLNPADPVIEGVVGTAERGVGGVTVELYHAGVRNPVAIRTTTSGGYYVFRFTAPGAYTVKITPPAGYRARDASETLFINMFDVVKLDFLLTR